MTSSRHLILAILTGAALLIGGGLLLVWPNYRKAGEMNDRAETLHAKSRDAQVQDETLANLQASLEQIRRKIDGELKTTPSSPNIADLMGRLSLRPDGVTVIDQSFTTGQAAAAVPGSDLTVQTTPLTIQVTGRFDAIFALIRSVETMNRLIRVASISLDGTEIEGDASQLESDTPLIAATIGLEAVFDPGAEEVD